MLKLTLFCSLSNWRWNWVSHLTFCPSDLLWNYPGGDISRRKYMEELYGNAITDVTATLVLWATHTFYNVIYWLLVHGDPHPLFFVRICMQQSIFTAFNIFTACLDPRLLVYCCCRTSRVLPLQYSREYYSSKYM